MTQEESTDFDIGYSTGIQVAQEDPGLDEMELYFTSVVCYGFAIQAAPLGQADFVLGFKFGYRDFLRGII